MYNIYLSLSLYIYIKIYLCVICIHIYIYIYTHTYVSVYMHRSVYIYMYICVYICTYVYIYIYIYIYVYIHIYIYIYIYIHMYTHNMGVSILFRQLFTHTHTYKRGGHLLGGVLAHRALFFRAVMFAIMCADYVQTCCLVIYAKILNEWTNPTYHMTPVLRYKIDGGRYTCYLQWVQFFKSWPDKALKQYFSCGSTCYHAIHGTFFLSFVLNYSFNVAMWKAHDLRLISGFSIYFKIMNFLTCFPDFSFSPRFLFLCDKYICSHASLFNVGLPKAVPPAILWEVGVFAKAEDHMAWGLGRMGIIYS